MRREAAVESSAMSATVDATGKELAKEIYQRLKKALLEAFRSRDELREMVRGQFQVSLDVVSLAPDLVTCVGDLIDWFTARSKLIALVEGAIAERADRGDLVEVRSLMRRLEEAGVPSEEAERRRLATLAATIERLEDQLEDLRARDAEPALAEEIAGQVRELRRALRRGFQPLPEGLRVGLGRRYLLSELIGEGGAAWVYRARDVRASSDVVVKVLKHPSDHSTEMVRRFREGADVQFSQCRHESTRAGVAEVYETGGEYEGYPFFVMRHYRGGDLGRAVAAAPARRLSRFDALTVLIAVARTLAALHVRGIAHNDVKPSNILLDSERRGWLTDFDLVETSAYTTVAAGRRGTTAYASPEQLLSGRGGASGDVYALGMTALFVLEGRAPSDDVAWRRRPSLDHLDEQPEELRQIVERAIAFDARERYGSMAEFAAALERARELVQEAGGLTEAALYEALLSVDATVEDRERLWDAVGGRTRVSHPDAPWRSVALALAHEANSQGSLDGLHQAVIARWPDVALRERERRIRHALSRAQDGGAGASFWPLFRGLCELSSEQLEEVIWRTGNLSRVDRNFGGLGAVLSLLELSQGREREVTAALVRAGGRLHHQLPDGGEVTGADVCLMLAALRGQGVLPVPPRASLPEIDPRWWHSSRSRHRVEAAVRASWAEWCEGWDDAPTEEKRRYMLLYDLAFALVRRLAFWTPPAPVAPERRLRIASALTLAPREMFLHFCKEFGVPAWAMHSAGESQVKQARAAVLFLATWGGTLEQATTFLARALADALRGDGEDLACLRRSLVEVGFTEATKNFAQGALGKQASRDDSRHLTTILQVAHAMLGSTPGRFPELVRDNNPMNRAERVALRDAVLAAVPPLEFDSLVEGLDADLGFLPGPSASQVIRAQALCESAEEHGVWSAFRDEVLRRYPDRHEAYAARLLERQGAL